jgi:hypothetical protein
VSKSKRDMKSKTGSYIITIAVAAIVNLAVYTLAPVVLIQYAGITIAVSTILSILGLVYCLYCIRAQAQYEVDTVTSKLRGPDTTPGGHHTFTCPECGGMGYYEIHETNISDYIICRYCGKPFSTK